MKENEKHQKPTWINSKERINLFFNFIQITLNWLHNCSFWIKLSINQPDRINILFDLPQIKGIMSLEIKFKCQIDKDRLDIKYWIK